MRLILNYVGGAINQSFCETYKQISKAGTIINFHTGLLMSEFQTGDDREKDNRELLLKKIEQTGAENTVIFFDGIADVFEDGLEIIKQAADVPEVNNTFATSKPETFSYIHEKFLNEEPAIYVDRKIGTLELAKQAGFMPVNFNDNDQMQKMAAVVSKDTGKEINYTQSKPLDFAVFNSDIPPLEKFIEPDKPNFIQRVINKVQASWDKKKLFKDNSYLTRKNNDKPEVVIAVGIKDNVLKGPAELSEENALVLKNLANNYNVRIIGCTAFSSPSKSEKSKYNQMMIASGVSEIYFLGNHSNGLVTSEGLTVKKEDPFIATKIKVYEELCNKYKLSQDDLFVLDAYGAMAANSTKKEHIGNFANNINQLKTMVDARFTQKNNI